MKKKLIQPWVIIVTVLVVIIIACVGWGISMNNKLITEAEKVEAQWSQVENQFQRRLDLIPNLVETVKGYASHESETLESLAAARAGLSSAYNDAQAVQQAGQPGDDAGMQAYSDAQNRLKGALNLYVNAVHEAYPDLKANEQFLSLQTQLEGTENRIAVERQRYIETVRDYNVMVRRFPASLIASMNGFETKPQFKADEGAATAPQVSF